MDIKSFGKCKIVTIKLVYFLTAVEISLNRHLDRGGAFILSTSGREEE